METSSTLGRNRTGIQTSSGNVQEMLENSAADAPRAPGSESALATFRQSLMSDADVLGSVPPPATVKGAVKSGMKMVTGKRPQALVDKVAERLAFERTGIRLYEALITKHQLKAGELTAISAERLAEIHRDETQHFALLIEAMQNLGADPTAQTPCADIVGVESAGLLQVITDARTTFAQSLHAILIAELADNDGWEMLIELAELEDQDELAQRFRAASLAEQTHLEQVRTWMRELMQGEAQVVGGGTRPS
jgi:ferritin-like protein